MIRVLHVLGGLGTGGTENLIMNWYRAIDRTRIQFDFLVRSSDQNFVDEIHDLGGEIYYTASFPAHAVKNYRQTKELLKTGKWDVIHVHANAALYMAPLTLAKKYGISCRILHSHSVQPQKSIFEVVHNFNRKRLGKYTTERLACSSKAGRWMFGDAPFKVLKNAIDIDSFLYSKADRNTVREEFGLVDRFVVGHVGRLAAVKNHGFLLEVFAKIREKRHDAALLLVGDGELKDQILEKAKALGLADSIVFTGRRNDVGKLMSAMDAFVLPSVFEGLPVVLVEAQANGLQCFSSKEITTEEVFITPKLHVISLEESPQSWANQILDIITGDKQRSGDKALLLQSGFGVESVISELEKIYESGV